MVDNRCDLQDRSSFTSVAFLIDDDDVITRTANILSHIGDEIEANFNQMQLRQQQQPRMALVEFFLNPMELFPEPHLLDNMMGDINRSLAVKEILTIVHFTLAVYAGVQLVRNFTSRFWNCFKLITFIIDYVSWY